jgi:hypothetical protein
METRVASSHLLLLLLVSFLCWLAACGQTPSPASATTPKPTTTSTLAVDVYGTPIVFRYHTASRAATGEGTPMHSPAGLSREVLRDLARLLLSEGFSSNEEQRDDDE